MWMLKEIPILFLKFSPLGYGCRHFYICHIFYPTTLVVLQVELAIFVWEWIKH